MKNLKELIEKNTTIRSIGFDDAPFSKMEALVNIAGIVCANTRFEGMLWGKITRDHTDATDTLIHLFGSSKFYQQVHVVLLDGLAFGGFNLIDLPLLTQAIQRPCIVVMRKQPDLEAIDKALKNFDDYEYRIELIKKAGKIHNIDNFYFQVIDEDPIIVAKVLQKITDQGYVPEPLRLAHLIGAAIITGQSSRRA